MNSEKTKKENLIILYSGGLESLGLIKFAKQMKKYPYCILIDYGQRMIQELDYAEQHLNNNNIKYHIVKVSNLNVSSGLTTDEKGTYEGVHEMFVPSRNLMFISLAASYAESMGINTIWYGATFDDYLNKFPDCCQEWIGRVNEVLKINGSMNIKLEAPFIGYTKKMIVEFLGNDLTDSIFFSGYGE